MPPTDALEFSKSPFGNSANRKAQSVPEATWLSTKVPEPSGSPPQLVELQDKPAFNEGKSPSPGKSVAAGKWFSMVLAPPSKETPLEAKTVKMASAAVWDLLKRQVKSFLFPNIKIKILSHLPQTKGGWGPEDHPPSCICEGRNAKTVPGPEGTRPRLPGLQQEGWDGPHFQTWTGPAARRGQAYGTASLTA